MDRSTGLLCALLCASLVVACDSDDATPITTADTVEVEEAEDTAVGPDAATGSEDTAAAPAPSGSLSWVFEARAGAVEGDAAVFYPEHEPLAYAAVDQPGFQIDVRAETVDVPAGRNLTLSIDGEPVASRTVPAADGDGHATVVFEAITLPEDDFEVALAVVDGNGAVCRATRRARVVTEACRVAVRVAADNGCIGGDADPDAAGTQARFIVRRVAGDCGYAALAVQYGEREDLLAPEPFNGKQNLYLTATLSPDEVPMQGPVEVTVRAIHAASPSLGSVVHSIFTYDAVPPAPRFSEPAALTGRLTLADDRDSDPANGIQHDVVVSVPNMPAAAPGAVTLYVDGREVGEMVPADGVWTTKSHTFTGNGEVSLRAVATDACGHSAEASTRVEVWTGSPDPVILEPLTGAVLLAKDDEVPETTDVYETRFRVRTGSDVGGMTLGVACAGSSGVRVEVGAVDLTGGASVVDVPVAIPIGVVGTEPTCVADVAWFNPATSPAVCLTLAIPAPTVTLTSPAEGARLAAREVNLIGRATGLDGQPVQATVISPTGATVQRRSVGVVHDGAWAGVIALDDLPDGGSDGKWSFVLDAVDRHGNLVSSTQTAPAVAVSVDTTPPAVAVVSPVDSLLQPTVNADHLDSDPAVPGYQTSIVVQMSGEEVAEGAQLCLSVGGIPRGCQEPAADSFRARWPRETLSPGANQVVATAVDAWGNASDPRLQVFDLDLDAPIVRIVTPPPGLVTALPSVDVVVQVLDADSGRPLDGAAVTLRVDGVTRYAGAPIPLGDGAYRFEDVALPAGVEATLRAVAEYSGSEGASADQTARYKVDPPSVAITSPATGSRFNLASDACLAGQVDCVTAVDVSFADLEVDSELSLHVDCEGEVATYTGTSGSGGAYRFDDVVFTHGGRCEVAAAATDAAGLVGASEPVSVYVDRRAPVVEEFLAPAGAALTHVHDQRPNTQGMQAPLKVRISGVDKGQTVTADMRWSDPDSGATGAKTLTYEMPIDAPEGGAYVVTFTEEGVDAGLIDYPEGRLAITIRLVDAAGNGSEGVKVADVQSDAPSARFTYPAWLGAAACDVTHPCAVGVCASGRCWHGWGAADGKLVSVRTDGLLTTRANLRVCSDAPAAAANPACASAGYHQVAMADAASGGVATVDLEGLPEAAQTLIAEVLPTATGQWQPSTAEDDLSVQRRGVYVDVTAPRVVAIASPSDTAEPYGVLNATEQHGDQPRRYQVAIESSEAGSVDVYVNGVVRASTAVNGAATVDVALVEGANTVAAVVSDKVGNTSPALGAGAMTFDLEVDTVAPELRFVSPSSSPLKGGDDLDVALSCDEEGATVHVQDDGHEVASASVSGGQVLFPHATDGLLADGTHGLSATVRDAAGNVTSVVTSPASVVVDTVAPAVSLIAPTASVSLTGADDADPMAPGVQLATRFNVSPSAATWALTIAAGCDDTWTCGAAQQIASGDAPADGGEVAETITLAPSAAISRFQIRMTVWDEAGNSDAARALATLIVQDCVVTVGGIADPTYIGAADCGGGSGGGCNVALTGRAAGEQCGAVTGLTLIRIGPSGEESVVAESDALVAGAADFDVEVANGEALSLRLDARVGSVVVASSAGYTRTVDLEAPRVAVAPVIAGDAPAPALFNASNDRGAWEGFQVEAHIVASDVNLAGGTIERIVRAADGVAADLAPANLTLPYTFSAASADLSATRVDLVDLADNTVTVTVRDAAGNESTASFSAEVDAQPPEPVVVSPITEKDVIRRASRVALSWKAPSEDGAGGAAAAEYDVRYSRLPINDPASFEAACRADALPHAGPIPAPAKPGAAESISVGGPDHRSFDDPCKLSATPDGGTWYFAVRARDDAGNWSDVTADSVVSTDALRLHVNRVTFGAAFEADAAISTMAARFLAAGGATVGDVNGDGAGDFAIGFAHSGGFCYFDGGAIDGDVEVTTRSSASHACLFDVGDLVADPSAKDLGSHIAPLGDVNGDGFADFGVAGKTDAALGFIAVYLGSAAGPDLAAPELLIRGFETLTSGYGGFCKAGNFDGDATLIGAERVSTDDIAVGEPGLDRVHVIPGRTSWTAGQPLELIDIADSGFRATYSAQTYQADFGQVAWFGNRCAAAGDLLTTPSGGPEADDLLVLQAANDDSRVFVIPGRAYGSDNARIITDLSGTPSDEDAVSVRLRQEPAPTGYVSGFGSSLQGEVDLTGDGVADVLVAHSGRASSVHDGMAVYVFDGDAIGLAQGGDLRVDVGDNAKVGRAWPGDNGYVVDSDPNSQFRAVSAIGDFDGWAWRGAETPDIAVSNKAFDAVELRLNHATDPGPEALGMFPTHDAVITHPAATGRFSAGLWVDGGADLDGDGWSDMLVGTASGALLVVR